MSMRNIGRALLGVLVLVTVPVTFGAAFGPGQWTVGLYGGNYAPGADDVLDDQATFGVRAGRMINKRFGIGGSIGVVSPDSKALSDPTLSGELDVDIVLVDLGVMVAFRPESRFILFLGGGIGGAFVSSDGQVTGPGGTVPFEDLTRDSFTVHAATGVLIPLGKRFTLRPMMKFRFFEAREDDEVDQEASLGVGFRF